MWFLIQRRRLYQQAEAETAKQAHDRSNPQPQEPTNDDTKNNQPNDNHGNLTKHNKIYIRSTTTDDPLDPRNWPLLSRAKNIALLAYLIFAQAWAGAAESMANRAASIEQNHSRVAENLVVAMYLFGVGMGSLLAGPVSDTIGRNATYLTGSFVYLCFVLGAALAPGFGGRVMCRFGVGLAGSATLTGNGASVRDQFRPVKRAFVFPVIAWANVAAPMMAPIACGWIVERLGWRWTEWITLIISTPAFLLALFFLPETSLPILLDWKARSLRRATGDTRYVSEHAESAHFMERLQKGLAMPARFLVREPVVTVLSIYLCLLWVLVFTFLSGFDSLFAETYGLSTAMTGSCFASIASGATSFTLLAPGLYSWARHHTEHVRGAPVAPEFRLWPGMIAGPLLPVALFWLGWGNRADVSIWSSLGACFLFGAVLIALYVSSYEYLIDSYGENSASALSSITFPRYMVAGGMVMAARPMYSGLGVQWTMTLLGCVAAVLAPAPLVFWKMGPELRERSEYAV
ncbi:major facilitator superfamily domain-containing protein [Dichotomopilus funicola]|uniref:Major facilitator superfamily domain-containing protein n=1 Tax=Dichotomopilus funicola TaxID=1934379 RepID=A0AAN6V7P6_9PEZI|nr:major facilitator superfamily domain-containing protein [Dichotomopilus funicola]